MRLYLGLGIVLALVASHFGAYRYGISTERDRRELAELRGGIKAADKSQEVVSDYVTRLESVDVPVAVAAGTLVERVCGPGGGAPVPDRAGDPAARAAPNPSAGFAGAIAADAGACAKNAEQLRSLIQWVRINSAAQK